MMPILWTETARADLRSLHAHIARDSPLYARRMVGRVKRSVERLRRSPGSGEIVPEWDRPEIRQIIAASYRVIYRWRGQVVEILGVIHAARQLPGHDPDPEESTGPIFTATDQVTGQTEDDSDADEIW